MLTEAKQMAKEVIEEAQTGTFALWEECDTLSYYYLFNIDDKGGNISNFRNAGKSSNKEFIFYKKYDYDLARGGINLVHSVLSGYVTNMSAQFGDLSFAVTVRSYSYKYTGNMADAQNNPQFLGYETFVGEFRNRDYRFIGCCNSIPDRISYAAQIQDVSAWMPFYLTLLLFSQKIMRFLTLPILYIVVLVLYFIRLSETIVRWEHIVVVSS